MMAISLNDRLADLRLALAGARAAVASGAAIDLAGLDDEIARLLEGEQRIAETARGATVFALEALLGEIDGIAVELRRGRAATEDERSRSARRATDAYGGGDAP
jgi:hypothetical protein